MTYEAQENLKKSVFARSNYNGSEDIRPNYHSISDLRKQNPAGVRKQQTLSGRPTNLPQTTGD